MCLEQFGLYRYAVSTHPDEFVPELPPEKILDPPMLSTPQICLQEFIMKN